MKRNPMHWFMNFIIRVYTRIVCRIDAPDFQSFPPHGPLIAYTNHTGQIEVPMLFAHLQPRDLTGWAKMEAWKNPFLRWVFSVWGAIPVHRGEADFSRAFIAGDELDRQLESRDQKLRRVVGCITRRDAAEFHRGLGVFQAIERGNAAGFVEGAGDVVLGRDADIPELARIELDARLADHLIDHLVAVKVENCKPIGFGHVIDMIGGDEAGSAGHVFDDDRRAAWNMFAEMARDQTGIGIKAAARGKADDNSNRFAFIIRRGRVGW